MNEPDKTPERPGRTSAGIEPLINLTETAKILGVCPKTVSRMAHAGEIPALRLGKYWRFRESVLDAWLNTRMTPAGQPKNTRPTHEG